MTGNYESNPKEGAREDAVPPAQLKQLDRKVEMKDTPTKYGKLALGLFMATFVLPIILVLIPEIFDNELTGLLSILAIIFFIWVGLPCCLGSLVLGVLGIIRKERPVAPAIIAVLLCVAPVLYVLYNFLTIGEVW